MDGRLKHDYNFFTETFGFVYRVNWCFALLYRYCPRDVDELRDNNIYFKDSVQYSLLIVILKIQ
jgi:hypothetical protein